MIMKKILFIYTGGTLGMDGEKNKPLIPSNYSYELLSFIPELKEIAEIDIKILFNIDSSNIGPVQWIELGKTIFSKLNDYDGFVIIHGTDTMVYTATALSFILRNINKPVIMTGSQKPLKVIGTDAKNNLIHASIFATYKIPEVAICFNAKLFRGNRTKKIDMWHYDAFTSLNRGLIAEIGVDVNLHSNILERKDAPFYENRISTDVAFITIFPGMSPNIIYRICESGIKGIVLEAFGFGNVPILGKYSLIPAIKSATSAGIPIIITSQTLYGKVDLTIYECGKMAMDAGAISAKDMTSEATLIKLMFMLGQNLKLEEISKEITKNWAGEIDE